MTFQWDNTFDVNIPADYVGTCTFKTTAKGVFQATENEKKVLNLLKGTVEIVGLRTREYQPSQKFQ